jgi:anti-sigma B factor antagonist
MKLKILTLDNLDIAIMEPVGSIIGGNETDELKVKAHDLLDQGNRKLILDLGKITYINSMGIGTLVHIYTSYERLQGKIKLCNLGKIVKNVFVITKLSSVFEVLETREEAIQSFRTNTKVK